MRVRNLGAVVLFALVSCAVAWAGGPRFVTGSRYSNPGQFMAFGSPMVGYATDPGAVSTSVTHAQGDAVVAAAAAVWNVPQSSLVLSQSGELAEHVSGLNSYFDGTSMVFPSDVMATNWQNIPIAVIYDTDGSVTDLLLGEGASDPGSCRQNEVTDSVDGFGADGTIQHALLIVNGRCVVNTTDSLNQLQYVMMREFGRAIGMGWSQLNDNVFTGSPAATAVQMSYWPVMHPLDVVCGSYTYLCMQNPFSLREDDIATLTMLYPVTAANQRTGQTITANAVYDMQAYLKFPDGLGMDAVNLVVRLRRGDQVDTWESVSGVTGAEYTQNYGNPVTGPPDAASDAGSTEGPDDGYAPIRLMTTSLNALVYFDWEPINPLYIGEYAIGNTQRGPTEYAGTEVQSWTYMGWGDYQWWVNTIADAGNTCYTLTSGSETQPQPVNATGWWNDVLCGRGRPAWGSVTVQAGHTWTLEVTTLDENGLVSTEKAEPVLGVWNASDATGTLPTVAAETAPFNTATPGLTQLMMSAASTTSAYRFAIADAFGDGRPDFGFAARVLYADSIAPATVGAGGGQVTITGMGFANGNRVLVNGVAAKVTSWSGNQIVATVPSAIAVAAKAGVPVDVEVLDAATGGSTTIQGALSYPGAGADLLSEVSAPAALETGVTASVPFAVKVLASDGVTPVSGAHVQFAVTGGQAGLSACGAAQSCLLSTNTSGVAATSLTGAVAGTVSITATEMSGGATVQVSMVDADPVRAVGIATPTAYVAAGSTGTIPVTLHAVQDGVAASGLPVAWSASGGVLLGSATTLTASDGSATVAVNSAAMGAGTATVTGCAWTSVCAAWSMVAVAATEWSPVLVSGAGQSVGYASALAPVVLRVTDAAGHGLGGASVTVSQTVTAWEGTCPSHGRCAAAPVLASNAVTLVTDGSGLVSVAPLTVDGVPEEVHMAVSTGTEGFVSLTLEKTP